ncbi:ribbon-helix-helix protein, CopG family [Microbacterium sp.]|uniref:ribbon-helix-helix protein, CopG family n=1 Tax=Microbacterium sp. TaxID=51671 RepID=UPI0039E5B23A
MQRTQISLTAEDRSVLDAEAARTGRSISALIRDAVAQTYGFRQDIEQDLRAIEVATGAWADRRVDGEAYVQGLRSGGRLDRATVR